jgi:hypothetical protein
MVLYLFSAYLISNAQNISILLLIFKIVSENLCLLKIYYKLIKMQKSLMLMVLIILIFCR